MPDVKLCNKIRVSLMSYKRNIVHPVTPRIR